MRWWSGPTAGWPFALGRCERNWPTGLGPLPETPPEFEFIRRAVLEAIDSGTEPSVVATQVVNAVKQHRFWILTHDEWMPALADHCRALVDQRNPTPPSITPDA